MITFANNIVATKYKVTERDLGDKAKVSKNGMHFYLHSYEVEGIGNYSTIKMRAALGLMKMESFIFTPLNKDAPLFNCDRVLAMGKETVMLEMYYTMLKQEFDERPINAVKENCKDLPEHDVGKHWYDSIRSENSVAKSGRHLLNDFSKLYEEYILAYLTQLDSAPECDVSEKKKKVDEYVQGLLTNGGPATDVFSKIIGKEATKELFEEYIFASK